MRSWVQHLALVVVRPRATTRRILENGPDGNAVVLLAIVSAMLKDFRVRALERFHDVEWWTPLAVGVVVLLLAVLMWGLYLLFSWAATLIGRTALFEGRGTYREVRQALAWGLAPFVWALLWRVPIALFAPAESSAAQLRVGNGITFEPGVLSQGCATTAAFALLELALIVWTLAVGSNALAVALRYSTWRGFGTIAATCVVPLVIAVAAVLTAI